MGAKRSGGNLPDCRRKRPFTTNGPSGEPVLGVLPKAQYALHHHPLTTNNSKYLTRNVWNRDVRIPRLYENKFINAKI
ncbi:MAG: hypothetical protein ACHBN1_38090 [Heteroscytonema crispum UTEX LB 1556]